MSALAKRNIYICVGTYKGAFIFKSTPDRSNWEMSGPFFKGSSVHFMFLDVRTKPTLYACANSIFWGSDVQISDDFGKTWKKPKKPIAFTKKSGIALKKIWQVTPGGKSRKDTLYAGVEPATLFVSDDRGETWKEMKALSNHDTHDKWMPGAGGLMVHSICPDNDDPQKVFVGISAAGTFFTQDGGKTWEPRNKGVLADFMPDKYPDVGQCVHHLEMHPADGQILYQQNHCGMYRTEDGGLNWIDISEGLPSRFGFPLLIHPHMPDTVYVIPEEGAEFRAPVDGAFGVYRSDNRGSTWKKFSRGMPKPPAYIHVHRQSLAADGENPCGIYVGTSTGEVFYSPDDGESWNILAQWLPPVFSVSAAVI